MNNFRFQRLELRDLMKVGSRAERWKSKSFRERV